jgi:hypothetical protein
MSDGRYPAWLTLIHEFAARLNEESKIRSDKTEDNLRYFIALTGELIDTISTNVIQFYLFSDYSGVL